MSELYGFPAEFEHISPKPVLQLVSGMSDAEFKELVEDLPGDVFEFFLSTKGFILLATLVGLRLYRRSSY